MSFNHSILDTFDQICLKEMDTVKLLDRMDKKYTFTVSELVEILEAAKHNYKVLTIDGKLFAHYETRYFDTQDYEMYTRHHNKHLNRHKVRFRSYLDSGILFFEVKYKTNKGRTIKKRVVRPFKDYTIDQEAQSLLRKRTPYTEDDLRESLRVYYSRITLVNKNLKERITIDFDLHYAFGEQTKSFQNMIIAEVKQSKSGESAFIELMKKRRIKDISISKYCLGMASLAPHVKKNNFKIKLHYVDKLCNHTA